MQLLAAEGIHQHQLNVQKSTRFIGIKVGKSNYSKNELNETKLPVRVIAQTAKTRSGWDTVLEGTEFKTTLSGADIQAGVGEKARADAKIILKGIVNRIQTEEKLESNSTVWQKQAGSGSTVETLKLPSFEGPALPKLTAPGGYIADIPKGNLKTEIEKLAKQPEYAYLKQLQTVKDVNWNQVQLAYDKWDYKQEGLTGAGAAIIALAVAAVTGGVGAGLIGAAQGTASAAVADAAFTALVSQASISLINNKGNIGNTLKELGRSRTVKNLVVAAATAGVADKIGASALNNVSDKQWVNNLTVNLANAGSAALINTAVNGGSLKDNLEANILAALVNTAHGEAASKIKQLDHHYIAHKIVHAVAGCAAAAANKGKCQDGAIGAAVGEILGEALLDGRDPGSLNVKDRAKIIAKAKLAAGTVAALSKGDVNTAANAAAVAVENNSLFQPQTTLEAGVRNAILRGDIQELRLLLSEANLSTADAAYAQRILASMEKIGESNSRLLAERYGVDWLNKVHHIFKGHQGSIGNTLIQKSGFMENAVVATQKAVDALKLTKTGNYPVTVTVNGITVIVRVYVNNGVSRIATILKM